MRWFGYYDAVATQATRDGGLDVTSEHAVAQVKMEGTRIAPGPIQALVGIASVVRKKALFFSLTGYSLAARSFAELADVALFEFAIDGDVIPVNQLARTYFDRN